MRSALARLGLFLMLALPCVGHAQHPMGELEERPGAGIAPNIERIDCQDCHQNHGIGDALLRPTYDRNGCLECHLNTAKNQKSDPHLGGVKVTDKAHILALAATGGSLGYQGKFVCLTCHDVHSQRRAAARCKVCHTDTREGAEDVEAHADHVCSDCHDAHVGARARVYRARSDHDPAGCLHCHGEGAEHEPVDARPGTLGHAMHDSEGGPEQSDPPLEGCASCHDPHAPEPPDADLCFTCHDQRVEQWERGGHGGDLTCLDCHPAHEIMPESVEEDVNPIARRCLACHSEKATPEDPDTPRVHDLEHPAPVFVSDGVRWEPLGDMALFSPTGVQVANGVNGDLTCSSCHRTHAPEAGREWAKRRTAGMPKACAACHGEQALPFYLYFHRPDRRESYREPGRAPP